jgi:activator of 2-hydroxyglutaryl-CoA dehydratase
VMALQSPPWSEQNVPGSTDTCFERRKHLINVLHELKSNISRVEQQHPYLGDDLSSTCDKAILSLQDTVAATAAIIDTSPSPKINPLSLALDRTGTSIINGLDKMGDGIIFLFLQIRKVID